MSSSSEFGSVEQHDSTSISTGQRLKPFLAMFQALLVVALIVICNVTSLAQPKEPPITLDNLLRSIKARITSQALITSLDSRGVDFQLAEEDEKRIRSAGPHYPATTMDLIIAAVRRNFRPGPLQVQYRLFLGNALDFFLQNKTQKDWKQLDIEGEVKTIPNNTYNTLYRLAQRYSVPFQGQYFDFRNDDPSGNEAEPSDSRDMETATNYSEQNRKIFVGSGGANEFPSVFSKTPDLINSLENPAKPWRIYLPSEKRQLDDLGSPLLKKSDIAQIKEFCRVLNGSEIERLPAIYNTELNRRVTSYLREQFSQTTKDFLDKDCVAATSRPARPSRRGPSSISFPPSLVEDLNRILLGPSMSERFKNDQTSSPRATPNQIPTGDELVRSNRTFLIKTYPDFIRNESEYAFVFLKQLEREDFSRLYELGDFYKFITQDNLPSDFGYIHVSIDAGSNSLGGCAEGIHPKETTKVVAPYLALWAAVFENTSDKPIMVGNFAVRENVSNKLRTLEEDKNILNAQAVRMDSLYRTGMLKPNEKIIVPLQLVLKYPKGIKELDPTELQAITDVADITSTQLTTTEEEKVLKKTSQITLPQGRINTSTIVDVLRRPSLTFAGREKYLYGPSMTIDSVEVGGIRSPVRPFTPDKPIITTSGYLGASCPFVLTYNTTKKSWINEGVVMKGFDAKDRESTDVKLLQRFDGRILIDEREAEDSYIDFLQVRVKTVVGQEILLRPRNKRLLSIDGDYVKLKQGQRLVVDFDMPRGLQALEYYLEVSGYYVPYNNTLPRGTR